MSVTVSSNFSVNNNIDSRNCITSFYYYSIASGCEGKYDELTLRLKFMGQRLKQVAISLPNFTQRASLVTVASNLAFLILNSAAYEPPISFTQAGILPNLFRRVVVQPSGPLPNSL